MKIRVCYARLKSNPGYNNVRAEAEIEVEVIDGNLDKAFARAWARVQREVNDILEDKPPVTDGDYLF